VVPHSGNACGRGYYMRYKSMIFWSTFFSFCDTQQASNRDHEKTKKTWGVFEKWNDNGLKVLMLCKYPSKHSMDLAKYF
jgi:hypothetical protein